MKSINLLFLTALLAIVTLCACSSKGNSAEADTKEKKMLVCYFSATGTTADAAKRIAELTGADLYEITPEARYTEADLDWRDSLSRSFVEMHTEGSRPALTGAMPDLEEYDVVLIGYPNWWNTHPTIVNTFIDAGNLEGKTVAPFMTSGGSDIVDSEKQLAAEYPALKFSKGLLMNGVSDDEIRQWVNGL